MVTGSMIDSNSSDLKFVLLLTAVDDRNANIGGLCSKLLLFAHRYIYDLLFEIFRQRWWVHCVFFVLVLVKARDTSQLVIFFALVFVLIFEFFFILSFSTTIHAFDKCIMVFIIFPVHWLL